MTEPAANSRADQVSRLIAAAHAQGLAVLAIEVEPKRIKLVTGPALPTAAEAASIARDGARRSCDEAFGD